MSFKALSDFVDSQSTPGDISGWLNNYKEIGLERAHDKTELDLVLPDDCLVVAGPPRLAKGTTSLSNASEDTDHFYVVGFLQGINYSETRQVQPLKAIGSRRHFFAATNSPVSIQVNRMLFLGKNLIHALYGKADSEEWKNWANLKYNDGGKDQDSSFDWWSNLEEDLYRIPFGLGVIYRTPRQMAGKVPPNLTAGAEYFEGCTLQSRQVGLQSGQAMIMESVTFMADRVLPFWDFRAYAAINNHSDSNDTI